MFSITVTCICVLLGLLLFRRRYWKFYNIPGPGFLDSLLGLFWVSDPNTYHLAMTEMAKKYGPVMHVSQVHLDMVVVSGYEALHELLIKKGKEFGGRPAGPTARYINRHKGILGAFEADEKWNALRKLSQFYLKQYGEGMTVLGKRIKEITEDMFETWKGLKDEPVDPEMLIFQTVVRSILFLTMSDKPTEEDPLIAKLQDYFNQAVVVYSFDQPWVIRFMDMFPWLRYFDAKPWKLIQKFNKTEDEIWEELKERSLQNAGTVSLIQVLMNTDDQQTKRALGNNAKVDLPESEVRAAVVGIILAGIATTKDVFYATVNLLAHNPIIQSKIYKEIQDVIGDLMRDVSLDDRAKMPYARAAIYELLRYMSVASESVPHRCSEDATLMGYPICKGTMLRANLWGLNHDPDIWPDPFVYRPERFLDSAGELVPADHPNRKHLMAFGVGTRVCLGESLALARLFLLITTLLQRFEVIPGEGNSKDITDCRRYLNYGTTLHSPNYKVIFKKR